MTSSQFFHCPDDDDDDDGDGRPLLLPLPRRALVATVACAAGLGCSHFPDGDGRLLLLLRWALEAMVGTGLCDVSDFVQGRRLKLTNSLGKCSQGTQCFNPS